LLTSCGELRLCSFIPEEQSLLTHDSALDDIDSYTLSFLINKYREGYKYLSKLIMRYFFALLLLPHV
jgi:hypothetical protein